MPMVKATLAMGLAAAAILTLAGCSKSQDNSASASSSADTTATASAEPAAAPSAEAAASAAPDTGATATAAVSTAGMIPLQIKDDSGAAVSGDPAAGQTVFTQCATCHSTQVGVNKVGPSLHGIIGRHSGMIPGFNYSSANKGSGIVWTEQELYKYLKDPQATVPGTYMTFTGVKDDQKRANVIAYLQENTK